MQQQEVFEINTYNPIVTSSYTRMQQQEAFEISAYNQVVASPCTRMQQQDFAVKCGGATALMVTAGFSRAAIKGSTRIVWWNHTPLLQV